MKLLQKLLVEIERLEGLKDDSVLPTIELLRELKDNVDYPVVKVDFDDLDARGGHGYGCCQVDVSKGDSTQRFWLKIRSSVNKKGVTAEICAFRPSGYVDSKKSVTGAWFKRS